MVLQLSASSEIVAPYQFFGEGRAVDLMPRLTKAGYNPAGIAFIIDQRQIAFTDARNNFDITLWTGDSAGTDEEGGLLLTLDSLLLRQLTQESSLVNGALKLDNNQWQELKADGEHSLYLNPPEVEAAHEKGYVFENKKFVPANETVAKVWYHLNRGRNIRSYVQIVSEASKNNYIVRLCFDRSKLGAPTLRSLALEGVNKNSDISSVNYLNISFGLIVGRSIKKKGGI